MSLKSRVLASFRQLHKARLQVFEGDVQALEAGRLKINSEFKKHKDITDKAKIEELIVVAEDSAKLLKTSVVQGRLVDDHTYEVKITKDIVLEENTLFKDNVILPPPRRRKKDTSKEDSTS